MKAKEIRKNWKKYDFQNCCAKGDAWTLEKWIDAAKTILDIDNVSITLIVKDALNEKCPVHADKNTFEEIAKWHLQRCLISTNTARRNGCWHISKNTARLPNALLSARTILPLSTTSKGAALSEA